MNRQHGDKKARCVSRPRRGSEPGSQEGMVTRACQLKTIPPRLLADLLGGMAGLVLGGQDHTPYPFGPRRYHTTPRKKLHTLEKKSKKVGTLPIAPSCKLERAVENASHHDVSHRALVARALR